MKKKVIGLSTLLLVLLLGLFSTSYAYSYKITNDDIDLIVNRFLPSGLRSEFKSRLKTQLNDLYNVQNYDTCVISVDYKNSYYNVWLYGFNASSVTNVSNSKNVHYMGVTLDASGMKYGVSYYPNYSNTWRLTWSGGVFGTGSQLLSKYLCVPNDLGTNGTLFSGPWQSLDVLTFAPSEIFVFTRNNNLQYVNNGNIAIVDSSDRLGDVQQGHNYGAVEVSCNYWDKARNSWVEFYWFANANSNNSDVVDIYISDFVNSSNNNIFPNVLVQTTYHSNNPDEFETDYFQPFIIADEHTVISGDIFSPTDTFDDPNYYNDYMNTINTIKNKDNTDKITDTLTDDSQVDSMLSELTSGDANDLAHRFGYSGIENPFVATIKNVVESTADVLLGSGNVTLDISFYGHQIILHSEDFVLPSNAIVTLIHLICNGFFIWGLYKYGFKLYQYINTGRIKKVIDETDSDKYYFF